MTMTAWRPCACLDCAPRPAGAVCVFPIVVLVLVVLAWLIACGAR